jgi:hypothetical protein
MLGRSRLVVSAVVLGGRTVGLGGLFVVAGGFGMSGFGHGGFLVARGAREIWKQ